MATIFRTTCIQEAWIGRNSGAKKPNAIANVSETFDLTNPNGNYVLVKRFSAKEEKRRIKAFVCYQSQLDADRIAFENHLNVFHLNGEGMPIDLAKGLSAYLNYLWLTNTFEPIAAIRR